MASEDMRGMKSSTRCPFGNVYDASVHTECPCPSCWADRSSAILSATRGSHANVGKEAVQRQVASLSTSQYNLRAPAEIPAEATAPEPAIARSISSRPRIVEILSSFFSYSGRMDRGSYWTVVAVDIAVLSLVCGSLGAVHSHSVAVREFASGVFIVTILAFLVSIFSACAKRLHDFDKSGGWSLVMCIGLLWLLIGVPLIGAYEGSPGRNRFGVPPPGWLRIGRD